MSTVERLPMPRSEHVRYWDGMGARAAWTSLGEALLLGALFAVCTGFWLAVIWWIFD